MARRGFLHGKPNVHHVQGRSGLHARKVHGDERYERANVGVVNWVNRTGWPARMRDTDMATTLFDAWRKAAQPMMARGMNCGFR